MRFTYFIDMCFSFFWYSLIQIAKVIIDYDKKAEIFSQWEN